MLWWSLTLASTVHHSYLGVMRSHSVQMRHLGALDLFQKNDRAQRQKPRWNHKSTKNASLDLRNGGSMRNHFLEFV